MFVQETERNAAEHPDVKTPGSQVQHVNNQQDETKTWLKLRRQSGFHLTNHQGCVCVYTVTAGTDV